MDPKTAERTPKATKAERINRALVVRELASCKTTIGMPGIDAKAKESLRSAIYVLEWVLNPETLTTTPTVASLVGHAEVDTKA